jgi:hypothetical protein
VFFVLLRDLSPLEVAKLRVVYGLVKEHVDVVERGKPPLDPRLNPMIDPKSVRIE